MPRNKTRKVGRSARIGRFISIEEAKRCPFKTVVETIPIKPKGKRNGGDPLQ